MGRFLYNIFLFDVDGVLTDSSKQRIPYEVLEKLGKIKQQRDLVYVVSGSGPQRLMAQGVSPEYFNGYFACLGNNFENFDSLDKPLAKPIMQLPKKMMSQFWDIISLMPRGYGGYFEERYGMVNVSLIGRGAPDEARKLYNSTENHRDYICQSMNEVWPEYQFLKGGLASIDVTYKNKGKEQVIDILRRKVLDSYKNSYYPIAWHFFGDRFDKFGNDKALADKLDNISLSGGLANCYKFVSGDPSRYKRLNSYLDRFINH